MSIDGEDKKITPGEQLLWSLFKLLQLLKIHQANNRLVMETLDDFRGAVRELCYEEGSINLRVYRSRFYLNEERLVCRPTLAVAATKMTEYLQVRDVHGLRFQDCGDITDESIVRFVGLLNQAEKEKDPIGWLQIQFDNADFAWVELLVDQDFKLPAVDAGLEELAQRTQSQAVGIMMHKAGSQAIASMARQSYSHALTSILNISGKLAANRRVGIQKSKRVIHDMIEVLTKDESILLGISTIRNYDDYTYTHSVNVAILAMCLAKRLGLSRRIIEQVGLCGLFHDLGKVDVPLALITKRGYLSASEYAEVQKHPVNSVRHIIKLNADHALKSRLLLPPFEHHLGVDLRGYPRTSRREHLSLMGRILAIADHYDALTSNRSYRPLAVSPDRALKIMMEVAGQKLDPILLKVFIEMVGIYPVGTLLLLDTQEVGLAVETPKGAEDGRPMVRLLVPVEDDKVVGGDLVDLTERDEATGQFRRNVVQCYHPSEFGIQPANFLVV